MSGNEFDIIGRYFASQPVTRRDVDLGIGDDAALISVPEGNQVAVTTDTLVAGVHFLEDANPEWVAHKALAANLSDLAAMGAMPAWCSLALTLPENDEGWIEAFCKGFYKLAEYFNVQLIGGDTTRGPLSISITLQGLVPTGQALTRSGAKVGDWIYVTGELGDSALGLDFILGNRDRTGLYAEALIRGHYLRQPRVLAGQKLRGIASSTLDISDGLISDLPHILKASGVGANVDAALIPVSSVLNELEKDPQVAAKMALCSGEEYELCFTVPEINRGALDTAFAHADIHLVCIGQIRSGSGLTLNWQGDAVDWQLAGWDHFSE
ncbi:thiamine-phosphate kinase [Veronia nyctiphanis]|uniref:Thiamine-monophosphate kinase n=1 Tax=Veronia nyctiphanis TaxID=1278244 RepID=A0A4Q0YVU4_9GAMM|nr:thiamine-phosphate kinase [Veronia nyctiphanis]RXJ73111.1 thiamine-phosphate kinase [Veronia nyctiphanis]